MSRSSQVQFSMIGRALLSVSSLLVAAGAMFWIWVGKSRLAVPGVGSSSTHIVCPDWMIVAAAVAVALACSMFWSSAVSERVGKTCLILVWGVTLTLLLLTGRHFVVRDSGEVVPSFFLYSGSEVYLATSGQPFFDYFGELHFCSRPFRVSLRHDASSAVMWSTPLVQHRLSEALLSVGAVQQCTKSL